MSRRSSSVGLPSNSTASMLESYEIFKKKHLSQNKEIIHKNSELTKANADLQRRLSLLRAENLSVKGAHFQLEVECAGLRDKLERAEHRLGVLETKLEREKARGGNVDPIQAEAVRALLRQALAAYDSFLPHADPTYAFPGSPTPSSPASPEPAMLCEADAPADPAPNVSISRRRSLAIRAARPSLSTRPDLSHISEDADGVGEQDEERDPPAVASPPVLDDLREEDSNASLAQSHGRLPTPRSSPDSSPAASPTARNPPLPEPQPAEEPASEEADLAHPLASTSTFEPPPLAPQPTVSVRRGARQSWAAQRNQSDASGNAEEQDAAALRRIERRARETAGPTKARSSSKGKGKEVVDTLAEERRALMEVQKEEVLPPRRRRTVLVPVSSSDSEVDAAPAPARRRSPSPPPPPPPPPVEEPQLPPALDDSSAAEEDSYVPRPTTRRKAGTPQAVEPTSPDRRVETVSGSAGLQRSAKPVTKMESLGEEARLAPPSRSGSVAPPPPPPPVEEPTEGRRARKSVNYALPKLNSKMRRPEDYVPAIKAARKSVVPRAPAAVRQSVQPTSSSQPERAVVREAVARPASSQPSASAGKPASRRSAKAEESGEESEAEEEVVERIKQRRASSLAASKAMREMEERMREVDGAVTRPVGRRQSGLV